MKLTVTAESEREIRMTRGFDAPRKLVFDALTKPELLKRWLGGAIGWTMDVCEIDLKVGGAYRWLWRKSTGEEMGVRGVYREIVPPERIVNTETFDDAWYPGEGLVTTTLIERAGKTTLEMMLQYESRAARDGVLKSPMESGVAMSYDNLAALLAALSRGEA